MDHSRQVGGARKRPAVRGGSTTLSKSINPQEYKMDPHLILLIEDFAEHQVAALQRSAIAPLPTALDYPEFSAEEFRMAERRTQALVARIAHMQ